MGRTGVNAGFVLGIACGAIVAYRFAVTRRSWRDHRSAKKFAAVAKKNAWLHSWRSFWWVGAVLVLFLTVVRATR